MKHFEFRVMNCKFIYNYQLDLNSHPELGSGSLNAANLIVNVILNQVQNDAQKVNPVINNKDVRLSGVEAFLYKN
jgi:hypothetical protein